MCKTCFIILLFIMLAFVPIATAQPLPPSTHILSYEAFIEGNAYAGEYISINAKIKNIERVIGQDRYTIELMPLSGVKDKTETRRAFVSVENPWGIEIKDQKMFTIDRKIGIPLIEGDNIVVVGRADKFVGMTRKISKGSGGTIILLLTKEEYNDREGVIYTSTREISPGVIALGAADLSLLDHNDQLLGGLVSAPTPIPTTPSYKPVPTSTPKPTPTPAPTGATIYVSSSPSGASIYLNGVYKGTAPTTLYDIPEGSYTVKFVKSDYEPCTRSARVSAHKTATVSCDLTPVQTVNWGIIGVILALVLFLFLAFVFYRKKKVPRARSFASPNIATDGSIPRPLIPVATEEKGADITTNDKTTDIAFKTDYEAEKTEVAAECSCAAVQESAVFASSAVNYQGTGVLYKVKVENKSSKPISDIKVKAFVPDVFLLKEDEKTIAMLEPNNARTVSFEIRPTGECGDCNISGRVNYYNYLTDGREEIEIPVKSVSIICPLLKAREISEEAWRTRVGSMVKAGENTKEKIPISAKSLFDTVINIVKGLNLYMVGKSVMGDDRFFRSVARFYGEGVKELKYAAQIEAIGGQKKSQLILKAWAEREDALTGFYHKMLDEIEKEVKIKGYIDDSMVQQFYHIGNRIDAVVEDSVVQHSTIGAGVDKNCPGCGRSMSGHEKFCPECGEELR